MLALGLLLGAGGGAALVVTLGTRPAHREIRVTVTRDAVPRRSDTLSQDAFVAGPAGPAPGGPGDRRETDREPARPSSGGDAWRPVMAPTSRPRQAVHAVSSTVVDRTPVPSLAGAVAIAIEPETAEELHDLRRRPAHGSYLERMLRGDHRAMVDVVDAIAGADGGQRRTWEVLLGGLVEAMADVAVRESVIDLPMGTPFWDAFTIEQCRRLVGSLASMGYRYDGRAGWVDGRVPDYRDLTQALADIGEEPRRLRVWPNQDEIASLFAGARPAPEELLAAAGPDYGVAEMQALLDEHAAGLAHLWQRWEAVRPVLLHDAREAEPPTFA